MAQEIENNKTKEPTLHLVKWQSIN
jgi:hypothetical protein